jgi:hypothetical protein
VTKSWILDKAVGGVGIVGTIFSSATNFVLNKHLKLLIILKKEGKISCVGRIFNLQKLLFIEPKSRCEIMECWLVCQHAYFLQSSVFVDSAPNVMHKL